MIRIVLLNILLCAMLSSETSADEIQPAADAPRPLSPAESLATMRIPDGYRLELVASEPLISEPSGVCWDERGDLFVCELHGYNLDGHFDIEELNKTGKLDREVRRIQATDEAIAKAESGTTGSVKRLIDTDSDGVMDKADVWADDLPPCYGIVPANGGIIVACAPHIVFLADRDGDGSAEVRETLFTGFEAGLLERRLNAPQWGLDGWIYFGDGRGGTITGPHLAAPVELARSDFRIKPDGSAIEPVSGSTGGMGFAFTESDERLVSSVGWPATPIVPLPWNDLARNAWLPSPSLNDANIVDRRCFPISQPHPWRTQRANDPGFSKYYTDRYGVAESAPNGYFTSACSPLVYQDTLLPGLYGHMLTCDPAQNLIARFELTHDGARLVMNRVAGEEQSEFLASTDQWFHPISLAHAPDGSILIVDFYREIIEDYSAIPRYLQQQYSLIAGREHGRLWRLTSGSIPVAKAVDDRRHIEAENETPSSALSGTFSPDSGEKGLATSDLVAELASPRHWRRQTAHRLLGERRAVDAAPEVARLVDGSQSPATILHAMHVLDQLGQLDAATLIRGLQAKDVGVRVHALRLAASRLDAEVALRTQVFNLIDDADQRVRLQMALSLGDCNDPQVAALLAALARTSAENETWLVAAIASSAISESRTPNDILGAVLSPSNEPEASAPGVPSSPAAKLSPRETELLTTLVQTIAVQRDDQQLGELLSTIAGLPATELRLQGQLLSSLATSLASREARALQSADGATALSQLLMHSSSIIRSSAVRVAGRLKLSESAAMRDAWNTALTTARSEERSIDERVAAIGLLSTAPNDKLTLLAELLQPQQPAQIQRAIVDALSSATEGPVVELLLQNFSMLSPEIRAYILDAVCSRQDRLPQLLDRIEQQQIAASELPSIRRVQLLEHSDASVRARAEKLLTTVTSAERQALIDRYRLALSGPRDVVAGRAVYERTCSNCHQLGKEGFAVGPDLDSVRSRPNDSLLLDVLDPSGTINPKFPSYTVVTTSGTIATGILASESATSITLRREKNETTTILRSDIEEIRASRQSLMPDGIEKDITPQQLADLLAFLRDSIGPPLPAGHVLFDDEPSFVEALTDGDGEATIVTSDIASGELALRMTPLQRSSERINGWRFRIVQNPAETADGEPQQFRYLRFAWKSQRGTSDDPRGVMLELAASGRWPKADEPTRRYFSGTNLSPWLATLVSASPPDDWTTVTVDLWKDFGEFELTGIAPTALGSPALFDRIELLRDVERAE